MKIQARTLLNSF